MNGIKISAFSSLLILFNTSLLMWNHFFSARTTFTKTIKRPAEATVDCYNKRNVSTKFRELYVTFPKKSCCLCFNQHCTEVRFGNFQSGIFITAIVKVSKFRKQNTKFSHPPKNQQNFVHGFSQAQKTVLKEECLYNGECLSF